MWTLLAASAVGWFGEMPPLPPFAQRFARIRTVVVGKVTAVEARTVKTLRLPNDPRPVEYHVAVVKIEAAIHGAAGLTHVKVGFVPSAETVRGRGYLAAPVLRVGQEALFYLYAHHKEPFLVAPGSYDVIERGPGQPMDEELGLCRRATKVLVDPIGALKAKAAQDRYLAAAVLLARYRTPPGPGAREELIGADESKRILEALAEGDWSGRDWRLDHPDGLFRLLGLTEKDGWADPGDFRQREAAAKRWIEKHAASYRIKRFAAEK
jgi:hypothetical protein